MPKAKKFPRITDKEFDRLSKQIDKDIARKQKEDFIVGRWMRLQYPNIFDAFLHRAKIDAKERRRQYEIRNFLGGFWKNEP